LPMEKIFVIRPLTPRQAAGNPRAVALHAKAVQIQFLVFYDIAVFRLFQHGKLEVLQAFHLAAFTAGKVRMAMLGMAARAHGKMPFVVVRLDPVRYVFCKERRKHAVDRHFVKPRNLFSYVVMA